MLRIRREIKQRQLQREQMNRGEPGACNNRPEGTLLPVQSVFCSCEDCQELFKKSSDKSQVNKVSVKQQRPPQRRQYPHDVIVSPSVTSSVCELYPPRDLVFTPLKEECYREPCNQKQFVKQLRKKHPANARRIGMFRSEEESHGFLPRIPPSYSNCSDPTGQFKKQFTNSHQHRQGCGRLSRINRLNDLNDDESHLMLRNTTAVLSIGNTVLQPQKRLPQFPLPQYQQFPMQNIQSNRYHQQKYDPLPPLKQVCPPHNNERVREPSMGNGKKVSIHESPSFLNLRSKFICEIKPRSTCPLCNENVNQAHTHHRVAESKYLTDLEWRLSNALNIYVFRNGVESEDPTLIHIGAMQRKNMKTILEVIHERMKFPLGYPVGLYTMDGVQILRTNELEMYNNYVVLASYDKFFKRVNYGVKKSPLLVMGRDSKHVRVLKLRNGETIPQWRVDKMALEERAYGFLPNTSTNKKYFIDPRTMPSPSMSPNAHICQYYPNQNKKCLHECPFLDRAPTCHKHDTIYCRGDGPPMENYDHEDDRDKFFMGDDNSYDTLRPRRKLDKYTSYLDSQTNLIDEQEQDEEEIAIEHEQNEHNSEIHEYPEDNKNIERVESPKPELSPRNSNRSMNNTNEEIHEILPRRSGNFETLSTVSKGSLVEEEGTLKKEDKFVEENKSSSHKLENQQQHEDHCPLQEKNSTKSMKSKKSTKSISNSDKIEEGKSNQTIVVEPHESTTKSRSRNVSKHSQVNTSSDEDIRNVQKLPPPPPPPLSNNSSRSSCARNTLTNILPTEFLENDRCTCKCVIVERFHECSCALGAHHGRSCSHVPRVFTNEGSDHQFQPRQSYPSMFQYQQQAQYQVPPPPPPIPQQQYAFDNSMYNQQLPNPHIQHLYQDTQNQQNQYQNNNSWSQHMKLPPVVTATNK